jgi:hypothetical protein
MGKKKANKVSVARSPGGRAGHFTSSWGDVMHIGGGYSESGPLSDFWQYQKGGEWKQINFSSKESPFPRMMSDGCQIGDEIFLFGGIQQLDEEVLIQNDLWRYDTRSKRWVLLQQETPISERYNHVATSISPHWMLVHGGECGGLLGDCWVYDISSQTFTQVPTPLDHSPCPRSSHSCVFVYPYVVLFGGVTNSSTLSGDATDSVPVYLNDLWLLDVSVSVDPSQWTWRMLPFEGLAPSPRDMASLVDVSELTERPYSVLLFGGYGLAEVDQDQDDEAESGGEGEKDAEEEIGSRNIAASEPQAEQSDFAESVSEVGPLSAALESSSLAVTVPVLLEESPAAGRLKRSGDDTSGGDEEDAESVCEAYLDDAWVLNLLSGATEEVALTSTAKKHDQHFNPGSGWRGSRFTVLRSAVGSLELLSFGGFDGHDFAGPVPSISLRSLAEPETAGGQHKS